MVLIIMDNQITVDKIEEFFLTANRGQVYDMVISYIEKMLIEKALERSFGNQVIAAKILGINRNTLRAKIKKLRIDKERFKQ